MRGGFTIFGELLLAGLAVGTCLNEADAVFLTRHLRTHFVPERHQILDPFHKPSGLDRSMASLAGS